MGAKEKRVRTPKEKRDLIYHIILYSVGGIVILFILLWNYIFGVSGDDSPFWKQEENGFVAFGKWISSPSTLHALLITFVSVIIVLVIVSIMNLIAKAIGVKNKKTATVYSLVKSLVKWIAIIAAAIVILEAWGARPANIIASMGVLALVIGLGCQTFIADVVAGIFLVADNAFEVGDIVVVDNFRGTVIDIGLKSTKIEDAGGNIKVVSNSAISTMVNLTNSLSLAIVELAIPYEENIKRTESLLLEHIKGMKDAIPAIVEGPYYKGVEALGDSAVILKIIAKVKEDDRFQVTRDMNRDLYLFLNDNQIVVPYPQVTITNGPNPADHPEWVDKEKEEKQAEEIIDSQKEETKDLEQNGF